MPMFPLGTVLFPYAVLPLHVFEPRYRVMTRRCLDGDREFGVVLIERGSEVGGGDVRFGVGTIARIVQVAETARRRLRARDGRLAPVPCRAAGCPTTRFRRPRSTFEEPAPAGDRRRRA